MTRFPGSDLAYSMAVISGSKIFCSRVAKTCRKPSEKNKLDCRYVYQITIIHLLRSYPRNLPHSGSVRVVLKTRPEKCPSTLDVRMPGWYSPFLHVMPFRFHLRISLIYLNTANKSTVPGKLTM